MITEEFFHLDCNPVIPECEYNCAKCITEIRSVLGGRSGVFEVTLGKRGETSGIVAKHDPDTVSTEELLNAFRNLPSFYRGHFVPQVLDA
jgi:hypothetical protein